MVNATLVAHDGAGNAGSVTATHDYTVDTVAPSASTTQLAIGVIVASATSW